MQKALKLRNHMLILFCHKVPERDVCVWTSVTGPILEMENGDALLEAGSRSENIICSVVHTGQEICSHAPFLCHDQLI